MKDARWGSTNATLLCYCGSVLQRIGVPRGRITASRQHLPAVTREARRRFWVSRKVGAVDEIEIGEVGRRDGRYVVLTTRSKLSLHLRTFHPATEKVFIPLPLFHLPPHPQTDKAQKKTSPERRHGTALLTHSKSLPQSQEPVPLPKIKTWLPSSPVGSPNCRCKVHVVCKSKRGGRKVC